MNDDSSIITKKVESEHKKEGSCKLKFIFRINLIHKVVNTLYVGKNISEVQH